MHKSHVVTNMKTCAEEYLEIIVEFQRSVGFPVVIKSLELDAQDWWQGFDAHSLDRVALQNKQFM